ncbi:hypothetical protein V6N13_146521 [Hibiscus sabdariffa]|uniref:Uncharacterized protein n=1 Tax=Hibiscus sabdariffa TaxID=183260 RepID=A0ABR2TTK1_9ROSI
MSETKTNGCNLTSAPVTVSRGKSSNVVLESVTMLVSTPITFRLRKEARISVSEANDARGILVVETSIHRYYVHVRRRRLGL